MVMIAPLFGIVSGGARRAAMDATDQSPAFALCALDRSNISFGQGWRAAVPTPCPGGAGFKSDSAHCPSLSSHRGQPAAARPCSRRRGRPISSSVSRLACLNRPVAAVSAGSPRSAITRSVSVTVSSHTGEPSGYGLIGTISSWLPAGSIPRCPGCPCGASPPWSAWRGCRSSTALFRAARLGASRMTNGSAVQDSGVDTMPRLASAFTAVLCPPRVHMSFSSSLSRMTSLRPPDGMRSKTTPLRPQGRSPARKITLVIVPRQMLFTLTHEVQP